MVFEFVFTFNRFLVTIKDMEENIEKINYLDKTIYLVKTAHVSKNSVEDVNHIIEEVNPDAICIELDEDRLNSLNNTDRWRDTDIVTVIKEKRVGLLMVNVILSSFQKRMAAHLDTKSGGEMVAGINASKERNVPLILADRKINTTFKRIWSSLGLWEKSKLIVTIMMSMFDNEEISEEDLANLKQSDMLEAALEEVGKEFPIVKRILVDERDMYLSQNIKNAPGKNIVAIIGAAHANGIKRHINEDIDIKQLEEIAPKSFLSSAVKWIIPLTIIGIIVYTLFVNLNTGLSQIKQWILWNGTLSAIGTAIALGHPLSILTAFIAAPITSLNPLLAAGWFAGLVEAHLRKPKVKDFEDLASDTSTIKGFWKNRITRILMVVILANVFSSIGTFIGGFGVFKSLFDIIG